MCCLVRNRYEQCPALSHAGGTRCQERWIRASDSLARLGDRLKLCKERAEP